MESFTENNDDSRSACDDQELAENLIPICSETILKNLIRKSDHNSKSNDINFDSLKQDFLKLKEHLNNEINDFEFRTKYQNLLYDIQSSIENENITKLQKELIKLKKVLMVMDFEDLIYIMAKTKTAEEKINNMEVVLLVGKTGSGKSTTLHCLAGSSFKYNDQNDHYEPFDIQPNLQNVITSNSSNSETRFILPIDINLERINRTDYITICDTPGFNDSAGAEVDIANTFGIVKAIRCCQSVRLVVLISRRSLGDRYDGIIEIAELISQMIPSILDHLNSIIYIYTKFSSNDEIKRCINEALNRDGLSETIMEILDSMVEKEPILIDPLNPTSAKNVLRKIHRMNKINHPNEIFQPLTNSKAFLSLNEQINFHERSINFALERRNFDLIMFKLGQLKRLKFYLENQTLETTFVRIVEQLKKFFDDIYLKGWNCVTNWSSEDLNSFEQTEVKESIELFKLPKVNILISEYLREEQNEKEVKYAENLEKLIYTKCVSLFEKIKDCSFDETDDQTAYHCLKKLNILFLNFKWKTIEELFKKSWQQVNCKILENTQTVSSMLEEKNFDFEKIADILNKCKNIYKIHEKIKTIDESNIIDTSISTDYDKALLVVKEYFSKESELILRNLTIQDKVDEEKINLLEYTISNLKAASNCSKLCILVDRTSEKLINSANEIFSIIENRNLSNIIMSRIKSCLDEMELWLKNSDSRTEDHELYNQARNKLSDFFLTMNSEFLGGSFDYLLNNEEEDINFAKVMSYFEIMRSAQWLDQNNLFKKLESFEKEYKSYTLNIYSISSIAKINKLIKSLIRYEPLGNTYIDTKNLIKNINEDYRQKLDKVLNDIREVSNPASDLNNDMELALQFLGELISNSLDIQNTAEFENIKKEIQNLVKDKYEDAKSNFENSFRELKDSNFKENAEDILREKCIVMLELFKKFLRVKNLYPTIYDQAKEQDDSEDIIETWKSNLLSYYSELFQRKDILRHNQQEREIERTILICKYLSPFDRYLNTENAKNENIKV
ncbi:helicase carboxy-terminal domain [Brachionus plicatilis]|uniref:Helicase carboxy-terminal domain n=1 Tax=Brachionus plicatilis TaxID=10195 RepID=A0A3M7QW06_BRAPC|nr:helicase carboxy-terminal domain [Brachionus plicatilis]